MFLSSYLLWSEQLELERVGMGCKLKVYGEDKLSRLKAITV